MKAGLAAAPAELNGSELRPAAARAAWLYADNDDDEEVWLKVRPAAAPAELNGSESRKDANARAKSRFDSFWISSPHLSTPRGTLQSEGTDTNSNNGLSTWCLDSCMLAKPKFISPLEARFMMVSIGSFFVTHCSW